MAKSTDDFVKKFGRANPEVAPLVFPQEFDEMVWNLQYAEIGAGWYRNRFLYLFAEDLQSLRPCLEAWWFLLPDMTNPLIVGRNAYGALAVIENADDVLSSLVIIDPVTLTYHTHESLRFDTFVGCTLPKNEIPQFLDAGVYDEFVEKGSLYLDRSLCLAIQKPLSLGGEMVLDNFEVEDIVDYYLTTGPIYERAFEDSLPAGAQKPAPPKWVNAVSDDNIDPSSFAFEEPPPLTEIGKEVRDALRGVGSLGGSLTSDCSPLAPVERAYGEYGEEVSRGVAACLTDEDPSIRALAALFFDSRPDAPGGEALVKAWVTRPDLFVDVENPWMTRHPIAWQLLRSIGARAGKGDRQAIIVAKKEAMVAGRAQSLISFLAGVDPLWVAKHAEEIVRENPDAGAPLLLCLRRGDVAAIGEKIAPLAAQDPNFRDHIDRFMSDGATKQRILSALPVD